MKHLIGKTCLIKYDINIMLDTIFTIIEVNEEQKWVKVTPHNRWYTKDTILLIGDTQTLNTVLNQHKQLVDTYNEHRYIEKEMKKKIQSLVASYNTTMSAN